MRKFKKLTMTLVALLSMATGAWAQESNEIIPTPVTGQTNQWTFTMPASDVELQVEYEPSYNVTFNTEGLDAEEAARFSAQPNTGVYKDETVTVTYTGTKRLIGFKAVKKSAVTYPLLSAATAEDIGKVVCAAGHLHTAKTAVPDGCTAVGILGKVTESGHGLILALKDATAQTWYIIDGWTSVTTYAGTKLKIVPNAALGANLTSYTTLGETTVSNWAVAQKSDYDAIFTNLGSTTGNNNGKTYDGNVNAYITTGVGGTAMSGTYWSATNYVSNSTWGFSSNYWDDKLKENDYSVRPVLGF